MGGGGVWKGAATRPKETSSFIKLAVTTLGWSSAVGKFRENLGARGPVYPILAPYIKLLHKWETNKRSGRSESALSKLFTFIGVGRGSGSALLSLEEV